MLQKSHYLYNSITRKRFKICTPHIFSTRIVFHLITSVKSSTLIHSLQHQNHNRSSHARTHATHTHTHAITANQLFQSAVPFLHYCRNSLSLFIVRLANLQSYHIDNYAFTAIQLSLWLRIYVELYAVLSLSYIVHFAHFI